MKRLTDKELDSLFRNAAGGYLPDYDPDEWKLMSVKLDQSPQVHFWKKLIPFTLIGLIIFSSGVWVGKQIWKGDGSVEIRQGEEAIDRIAIVSEHKIRSEDNEPSVPTQTISDEAIVAPKINKSVGSVESLESVNYSSSLIFTKESNLVEVEEIRDPKLNVESLILLMEEEVKQDTINKLVDTNDKKDSVSEGQEEEKSNKKVQKAGSIFIRLLASPDISSIEYHSALPEGSNYALLVEYQIVNHWTISSGGIWSMKRYSYEDEITYGTHTADRLDGSCRVLDIPLNATYYWKPKSKTTFMVSSGFSSYLMLSEDYYYTVNYTSSSRVYSTHVKRKNNEWFKMLNISLGIQHSLSDRIFLQVEPFFKAPLKGVGEGDVLLNSAGIFVGAKYKIK